MHGQAQAERRERELGLFRVREGDFRRLDRFVEVIRMPFIEQRVNQPGGAAADPRQDGRDARIRHQQPHRACRAQLVEEPVGHDIQTQRRPNRCLEQDSVQHLATDRNTGRTGDPWLFAARIHHGDVEGATAKVDRDLDAAVGVLADDRRRWFRKEGHFLEAGLQSCPLQPAECLGVGGCAFARVGPGKHDGVADHDAPYRLADGFVGLILQSPHDDRDQRADSEVGGPGVGSGESELSELVLYARQQTRIVAAAAFAVLTAVCVPAVRRQRAFPAVGLLMTGLEKRPHRLVACRALPTAMEIDKGGQGLRRWRCCLSRNRCRSPPARPWNSPRNYMRDEGAASLGRWPTPNTIRSRLVLIRSTYVVAAMDHSESLHRNSRATPEKRPRRGRRGSMPSSGAAYPTFSFSLTICLAVTLVAGGRCWPRPRSTHVCDRWSRWRQAGARTRNRASFP